MPAKEWYYRSVGQPLPQPAPKPEPPATQPEPKPGLTPTAKMQAALLLDVVKRAITKPLASEEQPPAEDPAVTRYKQVLSGETEPANLQELARAAHWALEHRNEIEF